jgi:hypothetical protein
MERPSNAHSTDMSTDAILARMRAGVKTVAEIRLRDFVVPVRVLSIDETNAIRRDAIRTTTVNQGDEVDKNIAMEKSTLKLASTLSSGPAGGVPILGDKLLGSLNLDEIHYLYNEYVKIMDDVNPTVEAMPEKEMRAIVDGLKKNTVSVRELSLRQLRATCLVFQDALQKQESQTSPKDS